MVRYVKDDDAYKSTLDALWSEGMKDEDLQMFVQLFGCLLTLFIIGLFQIIFCSSVHFLVHSTNGLS